MSRREDIDNAIWSDSEFHGLSPEAKLVYIWSFTNPRCGMAGIYKLVLGAIALETGLSGTDVHAALEELRQGRFVYYENGVLWVRSRVKHLRTKTPQIARSIARDVEQISGPLRDEFLAAYRSLGWLSDPLTTVIRGSRDRQEKCDEQAKSGDPQETVVRGSFDPLGQGKGKGSSEGNAPSRAREAAAEFDEWLADHAAVTSHTPPREGTKARAAITSAFGARRQEGYSVEDLKLATRGARANDYRRENGYDTAESVLRPTKIHDLIERGRRAGGGQGPSFEELAAAADRREREAEARRQKAGIS